MALVNGPLFSLDAAGQVGKAIVYSKWKGRSYVREYVTPANPRSLAQQFQRGILTALVAWWQYIKTQSALETTWTALASAGNYSTFNAFCKFDLDQEALANPPQATADGTGATVTGEVDQVAATGGINTINIQVQIATAPAIGDLLIVSLGTAGGAASTASTVTRTVSSKANSTATDTVEFNLTDVPAGVYHVAANYVGLDGVDSGWIATSTAATVTGTA